uniref:WW-binding domain-containing protein n=2 Tax=Clastoptera arizonana TaxID=38151 RepID=A0A1B6DIY0_9HEMI
MDIINIVAKDPEATVRVELMEHMPHIVMVCHEDKVKLQPLIASHLIPILMYLLLADSDSQVKKSAQNALLIIIVEQNVIERNVIEELICPVIIKLSHDDGFAGVDLMSKVAPLLGREVTERLFVPRLLPLCSNNLFMVRKMCAESFGDFCAVVSRHCTETLLLPKFVALCRDSVWGVRKACAEVIMSVSCACCLETRKRVLAPVYASLLSDESRWVRLSAFPTLGPFITTFAEPSITSLAYNQQGQLVLMNTQGFEFRVETQKNELQIRLLGGFENDSGRSIPSNCEGENLSLVKKQRLYNNHDKMSKMQSNQPLYKVEHISSNISENNDLEDYNSFHYWRDPLPDIEVDSRLGLDTFNTLSNDLSAKSTEDSLSSKLDAMFYNCSLSSADSSLDLSLDSTSFIPTHQKLSRLKAKLEPSQEIVPQQLIDHFVSMSDPSNANFTEIDLAHHCAFSLPAVALTLGPNNWDLLRDTYKALSLDKKWKVRRTVASSIHELAVIVGEEVATEDLVPIFSGLIKDLDEVRIGALKHLAHFLKLLRPSGRNTFLPKLVDFLMTDYEWNWRFREELADQLLQCLSLFSPQDICTHVSPVAIVLLLDKVAAVKNKALLLVTELVKHVSAKNSLLRELLTELAGQFAHSNRWNRRQTFALLCSCLINERVLSDEMFARDILPHLLDLSWDKVPNVRLAVARTLSSDIMHHHYFCDSQNPHYEILLQTLRRLQSDTDRDVRYFANYSPTKQDEQTDEEPT